MARADIRSDGRPVTVQHHSARGEVKRNSGNFTRGSQLLSHEVLMWLSGAKMPVLMWLVIFALAPEERALTAVFSSGRKSRATINNRIQEGLAAEGTLKGEGLTLTVRERVNRASEELRYAKNYEKGQILDVTGKIPELGLHRGTFTVVEHHA